ncbi:MAG: hypothetical protein Q7T71_15000 [Herbiconiux sp.]|nr:hypothetical protein [Herbiconiux sp.]
MMITEHSYLWLHDAEEERFTRELEQRRVAAERAAEAVTAATSAGADGAAAGRNRPRSRMARLLHPMSPAGGTM